MTFERLLGEYARPHDVTCKRRLSNAAYYMQVLNKGSYASLLDDLILVPVPVCKSRHSIQRRL
jgi:hypothetical protein